jgi:hypothetical protein
MKRELILEKLKRYNLFFGLAIDLIELYRFYEAGRMEAERVKTKAIILSLMEFEEFDEQAVEVFQQYLLKNESLLLNDSELKAQIEKYGAMSKRVLVLDEILKDDKVLSQNQF